MIPLLDRGHGRAAPPLGQAPGLDDVLLITQEAPLEAIAASARKNTYTMATDALAKLREGRTTLEELLRVMPSSALRELRATRS